MVGIENRQVGWSEIYSPTNHQPPNRERGHTMKGKRWTNQDYKRLVAMWHEGKPQSEIAQQLGCSLDDVPNTVQRLKKLGVPISHQKRRASKANLQTKFFDWDDYQIDYDEGDE